MLTAWTFALWVLTSRPLVPEAPCPADGPRPGTYAVSTLLIRADWANATAVGQRSEWRLDVDVSAACEVTLTAQRLTVDGRPLAKTESVAASGRLVHDVATLRWKSQTVVFALRFAGQHVAGFAFIPDSRPVAVGERVPLIAEAIARGDFGTIAPKLTDGSEVGRETACLIEHGLDHLVWSGPGYALPAPEGIGYSTCVEPSAPEHPPAPRAPLGRDDPFKRF